MSSQNTGRLIHLCASDTVIPLHAHLVLEDFRGETIPLFLDIHIKAFVPHAASFRKNCPRYFFLNIRGYMRELLPDASSRKLTNTLAFKLKKKFVFTLLPENDTIFA